MRVSTPWLSTGRARLSRPTLDQDFSILHPAFARKKIQRRSARRRIFRVKSGRKDGRLGERGNKHACVRPCVRGSPLCKLVTTTSNNRVVHVVDPRNGTLDRYPAFFLFPLRTDNSIGTRVARRLAGRIKLRQSEKERERAEKMIARH